jgi:hypothetical protein
VDGAGNAYVAGLAHSPDFPVTTGSFQTRNKAATTSGTASQIPGYNAFVTKINPAGTAFVFSTYLGGSGLTIPNGGFGNEVIFGDLANAIAVDGAGNVYVTGAAYSADFPVTTGAYQGKLSAVQPISSPLNFAKLGYNAFVTKLNPGGTNLVYSTLRQQLRYGLWDRDRPFRECVHRRNNHVARFSRRLRSHPVREQSRHYEQCGQRFCQPVKPDWHGAGLLDFLRRIGACNIRRPGAW